MLKEHADSGNTYNGSNWASHIKSMLDDNISLSTCVPPLYRAKKIVFFQTLILSLAKFDQFMSSNSKQVTLSISKFKFSAQELRKSVQNPLQRLSI